MDSGGAPQGVHRGHCSDEGDDLGIDRWTAHPRPAGKLGPVLAKRRRCHRRTVSGVTIRRGCLHPAQTLASQTQRRRSVVRSLGRVAVLLYTASWWRKARFSRASWRWPPQRNGRSRSRWSRRVIIELGFSPDQSRQVNHWPDRVLAKDKVPHPIECQKSAVPLIGGARDHGRRGLLARRRLGRSPSGSSANCRRPSFNLRSTRMSTGQRLLKAIEQKIAGQEIQRIEVEARPTPVSEMPRMGAPNRPWRARSGE